MSGMGLAIPATRGYSKGMPDARIKELEDQLSATNDTVKRLTRENLELRETVDATQRANKRIKRNSRQSGSDLRSQISVMQNRRG